MLAFRHLLLPAVILLGACTTLGPRAIEGSRTDYNVARETLLLLDQSGWSIERLFRDLEIRGFLSGGRGADGLELRVAPTARNAAAFDELMALLDLHPGRASYRLSNDAEVIDGTRLNLRTRSFAGVMHFLSQGVEVPEPDRRLGRVTVTRNAAGREFDWLEVTGGPMHVRSSTTRPANAAVAVRYRGHWFYVDDSDRETRSTFSLLGQLFALQAGNVEGRSPLLTIPVGGLGQRRASGGSVSRRLERERHHTSWPPAAGW